MTALILIWIILFALSLSLGCMVTGLLNVTGTGRAGDRLFLALWVGLVTLGTILLAAALIVPLGPVFATALTAAAVAAGALYTPGRRRVAELLPFLTVPNLAATLALALVVAALAVQTVSNRDSISYHFDIINWLSRIGVQPGLALIHPRFAFVSSWFAVPALFNHGILSARITTAANGFALLLAASHLLLCCRRALQGEGAPTDWFMIFAIPSTLFFPLLLNYPITPTTDFPVVVLTLVVAWSMLLLAPAAEERGPARGASLADRDLIPLWLAAAAFTVKLNTAPLLLVAGLFYLWRKRFRLQAFLVAGCLSLLLMLPLLLAGVVVSGCPLYPSALCLDLPWSIDPEVVKIEGASIKTRGKWGVPVRPAELAGVRYLSATWLKVWLQSDKTKVVGLVLFLGSLVCLAWTASVDRRRLRESWPTLALGVAGLLFLAILSPRPRFGWGYLTVIPCTLAFLHAPTLQRHLSRFVPGAKSDARAAALALALILLFLVPPSLFFRTTSERRISEAVRQGSIVLDDAPPLLLPPQIPNIRFDDEADLALPHGDYDREPVPSIDGARRMFYPLVPSASVRFRDPSRGAAAGFVGAGRADGE